MIKNILKQSWQIIGRNPGLWILGIFSTLLTGNEISFLVNNFNRFSHNFYSLSNNQILTKITNFNFSNAHLSWWVILIIILAFLILLILAVFAQVGLIISAKKNKEKQPIFLKIILKEAWEYFGLAFGVNLISLLLIYIFFALLSLPLAHLFIRSKQEIWLIIYFILNLIILLPLSLLIYFLARFTIIDFVLEKKRLSPPRLGCLVKAGASLRKSWDFLFKYLGQVIVFIIILALIGLCFGLLLFILTTTSSTPFILLSILFYSSIFRFLMPPLLVLMTFLIILIFIIIEGVFFAFQNIAWALFYLGKKGE